MAEIDVTRRRPGFEDGVVERTGFRLSWGAIFAGFVVATALQMVLSTLGIAIGFAAIDPQARVDAGDVGIGVAIWFALTAIISLFVGGMTTGRLAGVLTRGDGMTHGVVVWALSLLLALWLVVSGVGTVLGGITGFVARTATAAVAGAGPVAASVMQEGIPEADAADRLEAERRAREAQVRLQQQAREVGPEAADAASKAAWSALLLMGLSVAAAAGGAAMTARE
jgi:hypothetical protein